MFLERNHKRITIVFLIVAAIALASDIVRGPGSVADRVRQTLVAIVATLLWAGGMYLILAVQTRNKSMPRAFLRYVALGFCGFFGFFGFAAAFVGLLGCGPALGASWVAMTMYLRLRDREEKSEVTSAQSTSAARSPGSADL